ncbi:TIM barrel protein [Candidatus Woesearchaeota archaeon]|nr:TIM barrel protein [Candidatus Woesearchaeota archaeon]
MFKQLLFGTAGVPLSSPTRSSQDGVLQVRKLGLDAMELEFVRGVKMGPEAAAKMLDLSGKSKVVLTAHGPYYINLVSKEKPKIHASMNRILETARVAQACGAYSITFHAAFYQGTAKEQVYEDVRARMREIVSKLQEEGITRLWIRPETTGKATQFGDIDELIRLSQDVEQVMPCIDWSHLHARSAGRENTAEEFKNTLGKLETGLGKEALKNLHCHVSGIAYGEKGEKHHLVLKESDLNYKDLLKVLKSYKAAGVVISESPNIEVDARMMKDEYEKA